MRHFQSVEAQKTQTFKKPSILAISYSLYILIKTKKKKNPEIKSKRYTGVFP